MASLVPRRHDNGKNSSEIITNYLPLPVRIIKKSTKITLASKLRLEWASKKDNIHRVIRFKINHKLPNH